MDRKGHPYAFSVFISFFILLFPFISGAIVTGLVLEEIETRLVQGLAFALAGLVGSSIAKNRFGNLDFLKPNFLTKEEGKKYLYFIPIILVECLPLFFGLKDKISLALLVTYLFFTLAVGFTEELYFRGIIANALKEKGLKVAIFLSSLLFSLGHFLNLLIGVSLMDTLFQVILAFFFGLLAVQISFATKSIFIPIIWHFFHNLISTLTFATREEMGLYIGGLQCIVFILFSFYLGRKFPLLSIKKEEAETNN